MNKLKHIGILLVSLVPLTSLNNNAQAQFDPFITQPQLPPPINAPALEIQRQMERQRVTPRPNIAAPGSNATQSSSIDNLYNQGMYLFEQGDYQNALKVFDRVITLNPKLFEAYSSRALSRLALGDRHRALKDANQAVTIIPFSGRSDQRSMIAEVFAYSVRGNVRYELNDTDGALSDWSDASDIVIANGLDRVTPQLLSLIYLKFAVAQYAQGDRQESLQTAKYIRWNQSLADLQYLKSKGWGDRLLGDAQTFFNSPQMQALLAKVR